MGRRAGSSVPDGPRAAAGAGGGHGVSLGVAFLVLAALGGLIPVLIAVHFGAFGIPRVDDWSYLLAAFRFADTGVIEGNNFASMNLVGQLVLAVPVVALFGHQVSALQVQVIALGVLGLTAAFDLARQVVSSRRALFVAVTIALGPLWSGLAVSYMTDVPAFATAMICLALGVRALRDGTVRPVLFGLAVAAGLLAFSIREFSIVALLAVAIAAVVSPAGRAPGRRGAIIGTVAAAAVFAVAFSMWRRGLPGFNDLSVVAPSVQTIKSTVRLATLNLVLLGVLISPIVVLAGPGRIVRAARARAPRTSAVLAAGVSVVLAVEVFRHSSRPYVLGPSTFALPGIRPELIPTAVQVGIGLFGVASFALVLLAVLPPVLAALQRRPQLPEAGAWSAGRWVTTLAVVGYVLLVFGSPLVGLPLFERYLLQLVPVLGIFVLDRVATATTSAATPATIRASAAERGGATVVLAALAVLAFTLSMNLASFDGARWRLAEAVTPAAGGPERVGGSFEWVYFHSGRWKPYGSERWGRYTSPRACIVLRSEATRPSGEGVVAARSVWGPFGSQGWVVAHQRRPC